MPRRHSHAARRVAAGLLLATLGTAWAAEAGAPPASAPLTVERVRDLVTEFRAEPDFNRRRTERRLQWIADHEDAPAATTLPNWLFGLVQWLAEGARWLVWLIGATGVAVAAVFAWRWIRIQAQERPGEADARPSHVNDLDIRPESLPADISIVARGLLQRGDTRGALSLLYRGALSRLVHQHRLAIGAASTEGECLGLARHALPSDDGRYFEGLVQAWQTEVYADRRQAAETLAALCTQFGAHFGTIAPTAPERAAGAAA